MWKLSEPLLSLLLITSSLVPVSSSGSQEDYEVIDDYLEDNILSTEVEREEDIKNNLRMASHLLENEDKQLFGLKSLFNKRFLKNLDNFVHITDALDGDVTESCDLKTFELLRDNAINSGINIGRTNPIWMIPDSSRMRVTDIILNSRKIIAAKCIEFYRQHHKELIKQYGSDEIQLLDNRLETMMEQTTRVPVAPEEWQDQDDEKLAMAMIKYNSISNILVEAVIRAEEVFLKTRMDHLDKEKLESLVKKYHYEPCQKYYKMWNDLLEPLLDYSVVLEPNSEDKFYRSILLYRWCKVMRNKKQNISRAINEYHFE